MCISDNVLDHAIIVAIQLMPLYEIIIQAEKVICF